MLKRWFFQTLAVMALATFIPNIHVKNWVYAAIVAAVLGFLNSVVKPILIILTLPVSILTLGLFLFVVNAIVVKMAAFFVPGFFVYGWLPAILFSIGMSIVSSLLDDNKERS